MSVLERIGAVRPDYEHYSKHVHPAPSIALPDAVLKWYDIAPPDAPVPSDIRALAESNLRDASRAGELGLDGDLGFVILHRCGESFYFLLVATWRNDNELWETVWAKDGDARSGIPAMAVSRGRTARRSASGSSPPSTTRRWPGAGSSVRRGTRRRSRGTCRSTYEGDA